MLPEQKMVSFDNVLIGYDNDSQSKNPTKFYIHKCALSPDERSILADTRAARTDSALFHYQKALNTFRRTKNTDRSNEVHHLLALSYKLKGNYHVAYVHDSAAHSLVDSLQKLDQDYQISLMESPYSFRIKMVKGSIHHTDEQTTCEEPRVIAPESGNRPKTARFRGRFGIGTARVYRLHLGFRKKGAEAERRNFAPKSRH